jgi:hypothetical protein
MDVCIYSLLSKRTTGQPLFSHLLFCSWESFGVAGEWPNLRLVLRLAYLQKTVYMLNSLPYLELQRNIIAPRGFLKKTFHDILSLDHHLTQNTLKYVDSTRRCQIRDGWQQMLAFSSTPISVLKFFSGCREKKHKDYCFSSSSFLSLLLS